MNQLPPHPPPAPSWQPRFSIFGMILATVIVCVMAAGGGYLYQALRQEDARAQSTFVIFIIAAPVILIVLVSLLWNLSQTMRGDDQE
jgi:hypothetical protein